MTVCSCHVIYALQSESTLYSCLNVKELLAQSRCKIWSLSDCRWTWTHNHSVYKQTLNHFAKWLSVHLWTKWLWFRVQLQSLSLNHVVFSFKIYFFFSFCSDFNLKATVAKTAEITGLKQLFTPCFLLIAIFFSKIIPHGPSKKSHKK